MNSKLTQTQIVGLGYEWKKVRYKRNEMDKKKKKKIYKRAVIKVRSLLSLRNFIRTNLYINTVKITVG